MANRPAARKSQSRPAGLVAAFVVTLPISVGLVACDRETDPGSATGVWANPPPPPPPSADLGLLPTPTALVFGDFNGDGVEDFATLCGEGVPGPAELDVCAFDGKTFLGIWRAGPVGESSALGFIHMERVGQQLVVVGGAGRLHVLEASTGKEARTARLPGRMKAACVPDLTPLRVWVEGGTYSGLLDPAATKLTLEPSAPPPCRCEGAEGLALGARCAEVVGAPRSLEGAALARFAGHGTPTFALADVQSRGAAVPTLMKFQPTERDGAPIWSHPVAPGDPLAAANAPVPILDASESVVVSTYGSASSPRIIAFDPGTGAQRWDQASGTLSDLRVSTRRVYVLRFTRIEVRAAETGLVLGGVGVRDGGDPTPSPIQRIALTSGDAPEISAPSQVEARELLDLYREAEALARKEIPGALPTRIMLTGSLADGKAPRPLFAVFFSDPKPSGPPGEEFLKTHVTCIHGHCSAKATRRGSKEPTLAAPTCEFSKGWENIVKSGVPRDAVGFVNYDSVAGVGRWKFGVNGHPGMTRFVDANTCQLMGK